MAVENPFGIQGLTYPGENVRRGTFGFMLARGATIGSVAGGVVNLSGGDCAQSAPGSGMSVNQAVGESIVPGSSSTTQTGYPFRVSSITNTPVAAANVTNPRIDMHYQAVNDAAYTGVTNSGVIAVATGTPTSGATLSNLSGAPSLPTSSLLIGYVLVPANATNIITADLGDHRAQVALSLPVTLTAGNGIAVASALVSLLGRDATTTATVTTTATLPSPQSFNRIVYTLTSGSNLVITGWTSPTDGDWLFIDIIQPASGTTTNTVSWTGSTFKCPGGTKPTMSTGASVQDSYAVKYQESAFHLITLGQNFS